MASHQTVARTAEFEITASARGPFVVLMLRGRCTDGLLDVLQKRVFLQVRSVAVDASELGGVTMPLARLLYYRAQELKGQSQQLILVNPPDSLRGFLKLLGAVGRIPVLLSEGQIPGRLAEVPAAAQQLDDELKQIRRQLESNSLWQFTDREFFWICPFCADLVDGARVPSRIRIPQDAVERVWRHLHDGCRQYSPKEPRYLSRDQLDARVAEINEQKMSLSKGHVEALQTQVQSLSKKAQWAENMEKGVRIAANRQRNLLPTKAPAVDGCEISYTYRPAEEVSGDFYDFVELPDGRVAFVIGDVSGHGIEAGIVMGMTKKVLSIRLQELGDPVAAMKRTNEDITGDLDRSSFVTVCIVVFDPAARKVTCVRAGHNPPILYNPGWGASFRRFEKGGLGLGMAPAAVFDRQLEGEESEVHPGDVLLIYTDGIEEGKNAGAEEFGMERMFKVLQAEAAKPGSYLLGALFYEFERFAGKVAQEDDLTALCIKFK